MENGITNGEIGKIERKVRIKIGKGHNREGNRKLFESYKYTKSKYF